jgi:hypothetical protein
VEVERLSAEASENKVMMYVLVCFFAEIKTGCFLRLCVEQFYFLAGLFLLNLCCSSDSLFD